jgi:hypothetical protein
MRGGRQGFISSGIRDDAAVSNDLDDYELDDGIIAEPNYSALANDDGEWYGQEFGFYSAWMAQSQRGKPARYAGAEGGYNSTGDIASLSSADS